MQRNESIFRYQGASYSKKQQLLIKLLQQHLPQKQMYHQLTVLSYLAQTVDRHNLLHPTTFHLLAHQPWISLLPTSSLYYPAQRVDKHNLLHPAFFHLLAHQLRTSLLPTTRLHRLHHTRITCQNQPNLLHSVLTQTLSYAFMRTETVNQTPV